MLLNNNVEYNIKNIKHKIPNQLIFKNDIEMTDQNLLNNLYESLKYTINFFEKHKIKYIAIGGTLIGSVRHTGFIPWDNDFDLLIFKNDFDKLKLLLKEFNTGQHKIINCPPGFKIFYNKIPLGDIFVYDIDKDFKFSKSYPYVNDKPLFYVNRIYFPWIKYNLIDLLPVKKTIFEDFSINIPNNTKNVLKINYPNNNLLECICFNQDLHTRYEYFYFKTGSILENFFLKIPFIGPLIIYLTHVIINLFIKKLWSKF